MTHLQILAKQMNVTEADLSGFIAALQVWTAKGFTFDQAIERHMSQMRRLVNCATQIDTALVVDAFYPEAA